MLATLAVDLGTNFAIAWSKIALKLSHASSADLCCRMLFQLVSLKKACKPVTSAFVQLCLVALFLFLIIFTSTSMFRTQWSLLPILPPSDMDTIFSGQFVKIRSRILPFVCVGRRLVVPGSLQWPLP